MVTKEELCKKTCLACSGALPRIEGEELEAMHQALGSEWKVIDGHHLEREWSFSNFKEALEFTNRVGALAEEENHHPDITLSYGKVKVTVWTHKVDGLTESDFIWAAKCSDIES